MEQMCHVIVDRGLLKWALMVLPSVYRALMDIGQATEEAATPSTAISTTQQELLEHVHATLGMAAPSRMSMVHSVVAVKYHPRIHC